MTCIKTVAKVGTTDNSIFIHFTIFIFILLPSLFSVPCFKFQLSTFLLQFLSPRERASGGSVDKCLDLQRGDPRSSSRSHLGFFPPLIFVGQSSIISCVFNSIQACDITDLCHQIKWTYTVCIPPWFGVGEVAFAALGIVKNVIVVEESCKDFHP